MGDSRITGLTGHEEAAEATAQFEEASRGLKEALAAAKTYTPVSPVNSLASPVVTTGALGLPTDAATRKAIPIATGFVDYFPLAIACVAELSRAGNEQHNPGKPLFWDRSKSQDHADCLMRHFIERGTLDSDGIRHSAKVAWRAMAALQKELENE